MGADRPTDCFHWPSSMEVKDDRSREGHGEVGVAGRGEGEVGVTGGQMDRQMDGAGGCHIRTGCVRTKIQRSLFQAGNPS